MFIIDKLQNHNNIAEKINQYFFWFKKIGVEERKISETYCQWPPFCFKIMKNFMFASNLLER
ncbi:hypothetical protein CEE39_03595 [bacterium (candidate division B38) B3_B38]|nr:MAG: hypothetical protein CEE39_03595 [bacterium (candidate division B38) B3_B38]